MRVEYISASGKPIIYNYKKNLIINKPKCLNCGTRLRSVYYVKDRIQKRMGYLCIECNTVFIYNKYAKIIHISSKNIKKKGI